MVKKRTRHVTEYARQRGGRTEWFASAGDTMPADDETTDDPIIADSRDFHKVELWTDDNRIERSCSRGRVSDIHDRIVRYWPNSARIVSHSITVKADRGSFCKFGCRKAK
jgi:hypothetical protein